MNKKASEKIMSVWFVFIVVIVASGEIFLMGKYVASPIDIRKIEADTIHSVLMECFVTNGFINEAVLKEDFNVYSYCGLNEGVFMEEDFYFNVSFINYRTMEKERSDIFLNKLNSFESDCDVARGGDYSNFPACVFSSENYFFINKTGEVERIKVNVLTASNQRGGNEI